MLKKLLKAVATSVSSPFSGNAKKMTNSDYSKLVDDKQLIQKIQIEDTPFFAGKQEGKWYLLLGKYRLTDALPSIVDVVNDAKQTTWERYFDIMQIIATETYHKIQKEAMEQMKEAIPNANLNEKDKERLRRYLNRAEPTDQKN